MKLFSGKIIVASLAVAAALCVTAVGFSAWLVGGSETPELTGNVTVDGVVDKSFVVAVGEGEGSQSLCYGAPAEAAVSYGWLYSDGASQENLTLVYNFTFSNYSQGTSFRLNISASDGKSASVYSSDFVRYSDMYEGLTLYDGQEASYLSAVQKGFIADVSSAQISAEIPSGSPLTYSDGAFTFSEGGSQPFTVKVSITFAWGEAFGGENPYNTYKNLTEGKDRIEAVDTLSYLAACLEGVSYKITFAKI